MNLSLCFFLSPFLLFCRFIWVYLFAVLWHCEYCFSVCACQVSIHSVWLGNNITPLREEEWDEDEEDEADAPAPASPPISPINSRSHLLNTRIHTQTHHLSSLSFVIAVGFLSFFLLCLQNELLSFNIFFSLYMCQGKAIDALKPPLICFIFFSLFVFCVFINHGVLLLLRSSWSQWTPWPFVSQKCI